MNKNSLYFASFALLLFIGQVSSQDHLWTFDEDSGTISYDKGTSRNSVNAVLNNAQWRDLSKVGVGAAVHITGADNSFVSFGNGGGNNFPGGNNDDSSDEDDNTEENNFPHHHDDNNDNDGGNRLLPHHHDDNNDSNGGDNFPNNDGNNGGDNFPNNDNNGGDNFPNNDGNNGGDDSHHHHHHGDNGGNNFPDIGQFGTQDFTVAFWFQTTDSSLALADLVGNRAASGHGNFFSVRLSSDGYVSAEVDQDASGTNYIGFRSVRGGYNDGNWHQVVVTRSGTSLILYIDGTASNSGTGAGVANINNGVVFKIGRSLVASNVARFALDSVFDDLAIYSSAISAFQVSALYQGATNQ